MFGQGEHVSQPELQAPGYGVIADLDNVGDVEGQMRQVGLVFIRVALLGGIAVRVHTVGRCPSIISRTTTAPQVGEVVCTTAAAEWNSQW